MRRTLDTHNASECAYSSLATAHNPREQLETQPAQNRDVLDFMEDYDAEQPDRSSWAGSHGRSVAPAAILCASRVARRNGADGTRNTRGCDAPSSGAAGRSASLPSQKASLPKGTIPKGLKTGESQVHLANNTMNNLPKLADPRLQSAVANFFESASREDYDLYNNN